MSSTKINKENDFSIDIEGVNYKIPFAVHQLIHKTSEERDKYRALAEGWNDVKYDMPKVGLNVKVFTNECEIKIAHCSNSNSWYDEKEPIEYKVLMWKYR